VCAVRVSALGALLVITFFAHVIARQNSSGTRNVFRLWLAEATGDVRADADDEDSKMGVSQTFAGPI
jgi:ABC-type phosphate transport system substrate-binding protein